VSDYLSATSSALKLNILQFLLGIKQAASFISI
jgi:hypothetical protein